MLPCRVAWERQGFVDGGPRRSALVCMGMPITLRRIVQADALPTTNGAHANADRRPVLPLPTATTASLAIEALPARPPTNHKHFLTAHTLCAHHVLCSKGSPRPPDKCARRLPSRPFLVKRSNLISALRFHFHRSTQHWCCVCEDVALPALGSEAPDGSFFVI